MLPCRGEVVEVNAALAQRPEAVNTDPHNTWMIAIKVANPEDLDALLDAAAYNRTDEVNE